MTAEEYYKRWENTAKTIPDIMIEFAELHVKAALQKAIDLEVDGCGCGEADMIKSHIKSIINAYPKELIK